jgi:hypothetical protein
MIFLRYCRVLTRPSVGVVWTTAAILAQFQLANNDHRRINQANFAGIWARLTAKLDRIGGERPACPAGGSPALRSG